MRKFWENQEKKTKAAYETLGYLPDSLSVFSIFFFFIQISSDLPNNTKDKINKCNNIWKFFSSLSFPPFHHHFYHNNLYTFPLKRDKNKNTKYCYSDNTAGFLRESGSTESAPTLHHPNNHISKL